MLSSCDSECLGCQGIQVLILLLIMIFLQPGGVCDACPIMFCVCDPTILYLKLMLLIMMLSMSSHGKLEDSDETLFDEP